MSEGYREQKMDLQMELVDLNRRCAGRRQAPNEPGRVPDKSRRTPGETGAFRRQAAAGAARGAGGSPEGRNRIRGGSRPARSGNGERNPYLSGYGQNAEKYGTAGSRFGSAGRAVYEEGRKAGAGNVRAPGKNAVAWENRRKKRCALFLYRMIGFAVAVLIFAVFTFLFFFGERGAAEAHSPNLTGTPIGEPQAGGRSAPPALTEDFLTPNEYSRPGEKLAEVKNIFVHYTANQNTSAAQNRSYFEQLKDTGERSASAHFIIGYEGEIVQCVPLEEIAYAVAGRNYDSISIECCYMSKDGSFEKATYDSLVSLLKWLLDVYDLGPEDVLRHYDAGGKLCPVYYVDHEDAWEQLKADIK